MSQYAEIRRLAEQEIALRGGADENACIEWCKAFKALRKAVPDWTAAVLELIRENESLRAQLAASKRKGRK